MEWAEPRYSPRDGAGKKVDAETCHKVYSAILGALTLNGKHLKDLLGRGLNNDGHKVWSLAQKIGYRTLGKGRGESVQQVIAAGLEQTFPGDPGLFVQEKDGRRWWTLSGGGRILILLRNLKAQIITLIVRLDEASTGGKYRYLSSKKRGDASCGAPVHIPLAVQGLDKSVVRITEGVLKADLSAHISGMPTIGLPGVNSWRLAPRILSKLAFFGRTGAGRAPGFSH